MAAQHQVGNTAAALVLVLVAETLCQVNINVHINTRNTGRDSITGHIEGDTLVPGPATHGSGGSPSPSLGYQSLGSTDDVNIPHKVSKSSPRWIPCRSTMWVKDCEEGSIVVETLKSITEEVCQWFCNKNQQCKTYLYMKDEDSINCALTSAMEGTSLANGISGPDLPHKKPIMKTSKWPAEGTEDCSEFHFRDCLHEDLDEDQLGLEIQGTTWQKTKGRKHVWDCWRHCMEGQIPWCQVFAFAPDNIETCSKEENQQGPGCWGKCGGHYDIGQAQVNHFIFTNCNVLSGRVGDQYYEPKEKYHSCTTGSKLQGCRRGYCNLDHYGEKIDEDQLSDEMACKYSCYGYLKGNGKIFCTHYEYHKKEKRCVYYQVDTTKSVQYSCYMHAGPHDLKESGTPPNRSVIMDLTACVGDVITVPDGPHGSSLKNFSV